MFVVGIRGRVSTIVRPLQVRHMESRWIEWVRRLQAIAQNGLTFSKDPFDRERYEQVRRVAEEILASYPQLTIEDIRAAIAYGAEVARERIIPVPVVTAE